MLHSTAISMLCACKPASGAASDARLHVCRYFTPVILLRQSCSLQAPFIVLTQTDSDIICTRYSTCAGHPPPHIAYKQFISAFLSDWTVRTENPWEAHLFYVPALSYAYSGSSGDPTVHLRRVMAWVAEAHPFFNRTGGRDHFLWLPGDGCDWMEPNVLSLSRLCAVCRLLLSTALLAAMPPS